MRYFTRSSNIPLGNNDRGGYGINAVFYGDASATGGNINTAPGFSLAQIAKPAATILIGDTGLDQDGTYVAGAIPPTNYGASWVMADGDPPLATAPAYGQTGLYPQFRHNVETTVPTAQGNFKLPIKGRANFVFLDGHSKSLDIGTAFEIAPLVGGVPTEDGKALRTEPANNPVNRYPDIAYVLWNIY